MSRQKNSILINEHALNREPVPLTIAYCPMSLNNNSDLSQITLLEGVLNPTPIPFIACTIKDNVDLLQRETTRK